MRFDHLNLRAVGHFTDYELLFDQTKNFHLIYGPNEAGKSTTLRSITHFLFGFPGQTADSFLHSNNKLRIEGQLKKSNGDTLYFARRKGNKNTVLDGNDNPLNEELVNEFLNGISEKHFINMFALDHVRLREGGESLLQSGGNLGESLFSAASGISMLRKVFEDLEKKSGDIYKKRASTTKLNKLIKEEKDLLKEISEYQLKIQAWKELERAYNDGKKEIEDIIKLVRTLRTEQEKLQRVKVTLPKIAKLRDLATRLAELGSVPSLPDNIDVLRKESKQKLDLALKDKQRAEVECSEITNELEQVTIPEGLLEQATIIDALYREVQTYQNNIKQIPILEGERNQLEERVLSFLKEMDSLHSDIEKIDLYRLTAVKKETIRELIKMKPLLDQTLDKLGSEQNEIMDELLKKEVELAKLTELPDIDQLEEVIKTVRQAGPIEETLKALLIDKEQKEWQIKEEIRQLPLWDGTYKELIGLAIPSLTETVKKFEQERNELQHRIQKTKDLIKAQKEAIERHEERIRELESLAEIPSEDKLQKVRTIREEGWQLIRTKLQHGTIEESILNGQPIEIVYEDSVRNADQIADKMRIEAAKVGEKNKLLSDIESCNKKIDELEILDNHLEEELSSWETAWSELWRPSTINPLSPEEMREWLGKYDQIKLLVQEYKKTQANILDLESKTGQYKQALISALSQIVTVLEEKSLLELLSLAEKHQEKIRGDFYKRNNLETSLAESKRKMENISIKRSEVDVKLNNWKSEWAMAIQGTSISENTPTYVAEIVLGKYENGVLAYDELKRKEKEQQSLQTQISIFEERVNSTLHNVTLKFDEQNMELAVNQLNTALKKAQQDEATISNLNGQLKKRQSDLKMAINGIEQAESTLDGLFKQALCSNIEELEKLEKTFALKKEYESKIVDIEDELLQLGNGRLLQELIAESDIIDQDSIEIELEEIINELDSIERKRSELEQKHGVVKKEFEEKIQGNNTASVLAEQKKESLLAQLANLTDQYIQLKLASTLLQKGIEHYREQNQDPILKRASELFARLTLHSFAGLKVDYDEKDQPVLMGVRTNGDLVPIDGMSDGTTDQLYLSLRIASIEKYANENEPIPFIVDDILVHFDDTRSKETLRILLELSKKTQIIFFTHHARLVDIMNEMTLENEYQLTELKSDETVLV